jgi:DNA-binding MarR family transcriptional regulator
MGLTGPHARGNMAGVLNALWRAGYLTRQRGKSPDGGWCILYDLTVAGEAAVAELIATLPARLRP